MEVMQHIASTLGRGAPNSSSALGERDQPTHPTQGKIFSALFKGFAQNIPDAEVPSSSNSKDPTEPTLSADTSGQAIMASIMGVALASNSAVGDPQVASSAETNSAESAQNAQPSSPQGIESVPFVPQNVSVVQIHEAGAARQDSAATEAALQPLVDPAQSGEAPAMTPKQTASRAQDVLPIRNGHGAPANLAPVPLEQPSSNTALPSTPPPGSLISDQLSSPVAENQGRTNFLPAAYMNGGVQFLDRPSTGILPSAIAQEQGTQETTLLGQSLSVPVIGASGGGGQDPFGADAQGEGKGTLFHSRESRAPESVMRGNQPSLFIDQFTSARQTQPSPLGEGSPTVTSAAEQLKLTQAFLGEAHSATMTLTPGMVQTVHLELPSHDSGPLSVRISMTDQTVHTQFTTDRSDLGQFLLTRQDQLQQDLTKSGLELGQFQVHIDHHRQQEAPPESQSRWQGEARGDNHPRDQAEQQGQDKERQHARSTQALSVFA